MARVGCWLLYSKYAMFRWIQGIRSRTISGGGALGSGVDEKSTAGLYVPATTLRCRGSGGRVISMPITSPSFSGSRGADGSADDCTGFFAFVLDLEATNFPGRDRCMVST